MNLRPFDNAGGIHKVSKKAGDPFVSEMGRMPDYSSFFVSFFMSPKLQNQEKMCKTGRYFCQGKNLFDSFPNYPHVTSRGQCDFI